MSIENIISFQNLYYSDLLKQYFRQIGNNLYILYYFYLTTFIVIHLKTINGMTGKQIKYCCLWCTNN